jgi:hypothetical protein
MYYSNIQKLSSYAATKVGLETTLQQASRQLRGCPFQLTRAQAQLLELSERRDGVCMYPHPQQNDSPSMKQCSTPCLPRTLECSVCCEEFPHWDIVLCSCGDVYHPWCAAQWFSSNAACVVPGCGMVDPLWYSSWGFGDYARVFAMESTKTKTTWATADSPPSRPMKSFGAYGSSIIHLLLLLDNVLVLHVHISAFVFPMTSKSHLS